MKNRLIAARAEATGKKKSVKNEERNWFTMSSCYFSKRSQAEGWIVALYSKPEVPLGLKMTTVAGLGK
jgi:hypothetical protein